MSWLKMRDASRNELDETAQRILVEQEYKKRLAMVQAGVQHILMRMKWGKFNPDKSSMYSQESPIAYLAAYTTTTKAIVLIVKDDRATLIEDDPALFPSDTLCTKLRMLVN